MKRTCKLVVIAFMFLLLFSSGYARADASGTCGDNLTWELSNTGVLTISGKGKMMDFNENEGIFPPWASREYFNGDTKIIIKKVVIKNGVTSIGQSAFNGSTLTSISIPGSVTSIGAAAFFCSKLKSIEIPDGVKSIGIMAFHYCQDLQTITLPQNSLTTIDMYAFDQCKITTISIPESVRTIGDGMCYLCSNLTSAYIYCSDATVEGEYLFYGCSPELTVYCYDGSTAHEYVASHGIAYELMPYPLDRFDLQLPEDLITIEAQAFSGIKGRRVRLAENVTTIGELAFSHCPKLLSVYIPNNCTNIAANAFYDVSNLTIYGYSGSYAESYANEHGYGFIDMYAWE